MMSCFCIQTQDIVALKVEQAWDKNQIEDLLLPLGVRLNIPPFLDKRQQMLPADVRSTKSIASVQIHVERAVGRLKDFKLLDGRIDNSLFDLLKRTIYVAAMLCNFLPHFCA